MKKLIQHTTTVYYERLQQSQELHSSKYLHSFITLY